MSREGALKVRQETGVTLDDFSEVLTSAEALTRTALGVLDSLPVSTPAKESLREAREHLESELQEVRFELDPELCEVMTGQPLSERQPRLFEDLPRR